MKTLYKIIVDQRLGTFYVSADSTNDAARKLKHYLDNNDIGYEVDREIQSIEVVNTQAKSTTFLE